MGVNPYLMWIVGAEVEKDDPRFDRSIWEKVDKDCEWYNVEVPVLEGEWPCDNFDLVTARDLSNLPEERPTLEQVYYYGSPMVAGPDNPDKVVGYVICQSRDRHLMRGLYLIPGFKELFSEKEYVILPQENLDNLDYRYRREPDKSKAEAAFAEHRLIEMYSPWQTDQWYSLAIHVLHFVGWTGIKRSDLRPMMVFDWS